MNKEQYITETKQFRKEMDDILQRMKERRTDLEAQILFSAEGVETFTEMFRQLAHSIRDLESAIMRQGMVLKSIGNPTPYPQSYNPESSVVEPTADGLKL